MKLSRKVFSFVMALVMVISAVMTVPAYALGTASAKGPDTTIAEGFANQVSQMVVVNKDGSLGLKADLVKGLTGDQATTLNKFVNDLNAKKVGILINTKNGPVTYGMTVKETDSVSSVNSPANASGRESGGVYLALDSTWTSQLHDYNNWAIGAIAGVVVALMCSTGVGCLAVGIAVSFVIFVIGQIIRPYLPTTITFHMRNPYWSGGHLYTTIYSQPFKKGAWYNGLWIYSNTIKII